MAGLNDKSQANPNAFLARPRTLENPGVTPAFVHGDIVVRLEKLIEMLGKAASIKPDFMGTKLALATLKETKSSIDGVLNNSKTDDETLDEEQQRPRF